jgi:hypothetical protein
MARVRLRSAPFAAVYGPMAGRARSVWTEQMLMIFPGSAWQHPSGDGAAHDEGAGEVGVDHAPPVREAHVEERFAVLDAGVVDEDVDGTHVGFDRLDGGGHGGFLDDVEGAGAIRSSPKCWASLVRVSSRRAGSRPLRTIVAPASASPSAMASPIPRLEPVTSATRPVRSKAEVICFFPVSRTRRCSRG